MIAVRGKPILEHIIDGLRTAGQVQLEVRAPSGEAVCKVLRTIEGVRLADVEGKLADGWFSISVRADSSTDVRLPIIAAMQAKDWKLREIHRVPPGLEEVFVEVTHRQNR